MALRDFVDETGRAWQVWSTVPRPSTHEASRSDRKPAATGDRTAGAIPSFASGREHGWLTFASAAEKRRLSPIPSDWENATDDVLASYCERADRITPAR